MKVTQEDIRLSVTGDIRHLAFSSLTNISSEGSLSSLPEDLKIDGYFKKLSKKRNVFRWVPTSNSWQPVPIVKHWYASICLYVHTFITGANLCNHSTLVMRTPL